MQLKTKENIINIILAVSIIMFVSLVIAVNDFNDYEENYKKDFELKYSMDFGKILSENKMNLNGEYASKTHNMIIYGKNREVWEVIGTAYHETMHYLWHEFLNESQKSEWELLFNQSVSHRFLNDTEQIKLFNNGSILFVSAYAEKNVGEDFAESGKNYALKLNKLSKEKEEFMEKYVRELI